MNNGNKNTKNPVISAILNLFLWGVGYLYSGTRKAFGIGLIIFGILMHIPWFFIGIDGIFAFPYIFDTISMIILSVILAYDGYTGVKA